MGYFSVSVGCHWADKDTQLEHAALERNHASRIIAHGRPHRRLRRPDFVSHRTASSTQLVATPLNVFWPWVTTLLAERLDLQPRERVVDAFVFHLQMQTTSAEQSFSQVNRCSIRCLIRIVRSSRYSHEVSYPHED